MIEKEFKVAVRLAADTHVLPGQYVLSVEKLLEEKVEEGKRAEHKAEKAEHKVEAAGQAPQPEAGRTAEEGAGEGAEQKAETRSHQKRRPRSRGRRRHGRGHVPGGEGAAVPEAPEIKEETVAEQQAEEAPGE